jgi:hypothetical protein
VREKFGGRANSNEHFYFFAPGFDHFFREASDKRIGSELPKDTFLRASTFCCADCDDVKKDATRRPAHRLKSFNL